MERARHVVLIHRYFHPDTPPYASILRDIALELDATGMAVTVLTCQPSYNRAVVDRAPARELLGSRIDVRRFGVFDDRSSAVSKVVNMVLFCVRIMLAAPRLSQVDVVMAASTPPILVARVASILARLRRAAFVYHHQDIYPEITAAEGSRPAFFDLLRRVDAGTDRRASRVVVLSGDMRRTIEDRGVDPDRVMVLNNFDPWDLPALPPRPVRSSERMTVVYAGNLGHFQGLDTVFATMVELRDDPIDFHVIGDGPLRPRLEDLVRSDQLSSVVVHGYRPPDEVAAFLCERADVGLVTLRPGVVTAAYPSKTMSYLRNGVPILAYVEPASELARTLLDEGAGWCADPATPGSLATELAAIAADPPGFTRARERARSLYDAEFSRGGALKRWGEMFTGLADQSREET